MAGALGLVLTTDVPVSGQHAIPVYVDDTLPIVGPSRACVVVSGGEIPQAGGPPLAVRLAPAGTPAIGPALPVYVVPGGGSLSGIDPTLIYTNKMIALGPIAYFPQAESSGTVCTDESGNGRNGAYKAAGEPLLGQTGIGDGRTSALYDGVNDFANVFTAALAAAFNGAEGSLLIWSAGLASAGTAQRQISLQVDANNLVRIRWNASTGAVTFDYIAGATAKQVVAAAAMAAGAALTAFALTWTKSGDQMKAYVSGAQAGVTQTGLGVFAGALATTLCVIAGNDTSGTSAPFTGRQAHAAIFARALSAAEVLSAATL